METGDSLGRGEGWASVERLIALARSAHRTELSRERRERIRESLVERLAERRERRRMAAAFAAGASAMLVAGLLLKLASTALPWFGPSSLELARKPAGQHVVAE